MDRCINCLAVMPENEAVCPKCGCDNTVIEPRKMRQLMPGTILKNRFVLGLSINSNNIFTTYMAYDLDKDREVYVEELLPSGITKRSLGEVNVKVNSEYSAKFERAKRIIVHQTKAILESKIKGLDFLGAFVANNTFYIIRDCYKAPTLAQYIKFNKNISEKFAKHIVISLIKIMEPIHNLDIICGNIRPSNIIVKNDNSIVITEFGFGALNSVLSMPVYDGYAPLEQYKKSYRLSQKADIYSIGAVYYTVVSGKKPVSAKERSLDDTLKGFSKELGLNKSVENAVLNAMNITEKGRTDNLRDFYDEIISDNTVRNSKKTKSKKAKPKKQINSISIGKFNISYEKEFWYKVGIGVLGFVLIVIIVVSVFNIARKESQEEINSQNTMTTTITETTEQSTAAK